MEQLTLWLEAPLASRSPSPESERDCEVRADSCTSTYDAFRNSCLAGSPGKTFQARLRSNEGGAFRQLLDSMDVLGYGMAWRVLDAQFFGVAQRRRRLFLVGHLGDRRACEVLLESEGMRGDTPSSKAKREELARAAGRNLGAGGDAGSLTPWDVQSKRIFTPESCCPTLNSGTKEGMNIQPSVTYEVHDEPPQDRLVMSVSSGQANAEITTDNISPTLTCLHEAPIVFDRAAFNQGRAAQYMPHIERTELMDTLVAKGPHGVCMRLDDGA